jgi:uncharacterized membrane protein YqhA
MAKKNPSKDVRPFSPGRSRLEKYFERTLWGSRYIVLLAVVFGLISAVALFLTASYMIFDSLKLGIEGFAHTHLFEEFEKSVLIGVIGAIDLYLIGVVTLIFSFGMYELFISKVDEAHMDQSRNPLEIHSLDELKNNITKVIIIVLVVTFFEGVLLMEYKTPMDMLYLAVSIFAISFGLWFLHKRGKKDDGA